MNLSRLGVVLAFAALLPPTMASAEQPATGTARSVAARAAELRWSSDGTRAALRDELKRQLGNEKNTFGPLAGDGAEAEGTEPEGSALLGDFIGQVIGIPGPELVLSNGDYFYSGAEGHNATRKAALVTKYRGNGILAMAVFEGGLTFDVTKLTILVPHDHHLDPVMQEQFTRWARQEIDRTNADLQGSPTLHMSDNLVVETRTLGRP